MVDVEGRHGQGNCENTEVERERDEGCHSSPENGVITFC